MYLCSATRVVVTFEKLKLRKLETATDRVKISEANTRDTIVENRKIWMDYSEMRNKQKY